MKPEEIKHIRESLCVTQEKFAQLLGATVASVNRWESGKTKPSRLYIKEIKHLGANSGSYKCRRRELKNS